MIPKPFWITYSLLFLLITLCNTLESHPNKAAVANNKRHLIVSKYLLPPDHPLQKHLKKIFKNPRMFQSDIQFKQAGFDVKNGHKKFMVGAHPSIKKYVFKKFTDECFQRKQLDNYIRRVTGANKVREYIKKHKFKYLIVPHKWLYELPKSFVPKRSTHSYVLIAEKMDILEREETKNCYLKIKKRALRELCTILHDLDGCDAGLRNQPFTRSGKIAFVDTEHVGKFKPAFLNNIVPYLNPQKQKYAIALWNKLERKSQNKNPPATPVKPVTPKPLKKTSIKSKEEKSLFLPELPPQQKPQPLEGMLLLNHFRM